MSDDHADEPEVFEFNLHAGTNDFYEDTTYYDYEFKDRREDVRFYSEHYLQVEEGWALEIGVGTGRIALPAVRKGAKIFGLDLHQGMLDAAAQHRLRLPSKKQGNFRLQRADMRSFDLGERFSLITCPFNVLQHMYENEDWEQALARVKAHLAPGGLFIFDILFPDLEYLNRPPFQRFRGIDFKHPTWGCVYNYSEQSAYDPVRQLNHMFLYYEKVDPDGLAPAEAPDEHKIQLSHRYVFPQELESMLQRAGFEVLTRHGGFEGEPLGQGESMLYLCGHAVPKT